MTVAMPPWMTTAKLVQSAAKISHWPYTDPEVDAEMEHVRLGCADGGYGRVWDEGRESHPMGLMESKSTPRAGKCLLGGMDFFDPQPRTRSHSHSHPRLEGTPQIPMLQPHGVTLAQKETSGAGRRPMGNLSR